MYKWIACLFLLSTSLQAQDFFDKYPELTPFMQSIEKSQESLKQVIARGEEVLPHAYDGGIELTGFFKEGSIRKMELSVGISYGNHQINYYFRSDSLYLVKHTFDQFVWDEEKAALDYTQKETSFEGYYFFGKPFDSTHKGTGRYESENLDPETTLREEAKEYLAILNKKRQP